MRWPLTLAAALGGCWWWAATHPFPDALAATRERPWLTLMALNSPLALEALEVFHSLLPALWAVIGLQLAAAQKHIWRPRPDSRAGRGTLPPWPLGESDPEPAIVIGEVHHRVKRQEIRRPQWLTLPAKGLYTGTAVFGGVGSGKTSACIIPWATQLLRWRRSDPARRAAGLVLEVKGSMCPLVRRILEDAGRGEDWLEIGLEENANRSWNPLDTPEMDSFSLAYQLATLVNQLYGKGKEPFWQQASTNVLRNVLELFRTDPSTGGWVTLADLNDLVVSRDGIARKLDEVEAAVRDALEMSWVQVDREEFLDRVRSLRHYEVDDAPGQELIPWRLGDSAGGAGCYEAPATAALERQLRRLGAPYGVLRRPPASSAAPRDALETLLEVRKWYTNDWLQLDERTRSNIVEGISVFLGLFTTPSVRRVFSPPRPAGRGIEEPAETDDPESLERPVEGVLRPLPPMRELIETGRVLGMNLPSSTNPGLARTIGVMVKQAWLQAALQRAADMGKPSARYPAGFYFRPAMVLIDEYHMFATVGASDPCGDEKAFALTRESRVMPVVATQSITSLKSVTTEGDAWRTLMQTLRTKVFLSLSDDESCKIASGMCGKVKRMEKSTSVSENFSKGGVSHLSGRAGGAKGSVGTSYSYSRKMVELFQARDFAELDLNEGIALRFDGRVTDTATRVYPKPFYRPRDESYFRWREGAS